MSQEAEAPRGIVKVDHSLHWGGPGRWNDAYKTLSSHSDASGCFFPLPEYHGSVYVRRRDEGQRVNPGDRLGSLIWCCMQKPRWMMPLGMAQASR